jgi:hypothetical protein
MEPMTGMVTSLRGFPIRNEGRAVDINPEESQGSPGGSTGPQSAAVSGQGEGDPARDHSLLSPGERARINLALLYGGGRVVMTPGVTGLRQEWPSPMSAC